MENTFIWFIIKIYDKVNDFVSRYIENTILCRIYSSFFISSIVHILLLCLYFFDWVNWVEIYAYILVMIWVVVALMLLKYRYEILEDFLLNIGWDDLQNKKELELFSFNRQNYIENIRYKFYSNRWYIKSFIFTFIVSIPIFMSILNMNWFQLYYFLVLYFYTIILWSMWFHFILTSINVIKWLIDKINIKDWELNKFDIYYHDNMCWLKYLSMFSNVVSVTRFSWSLLIPLSFYVYDNESFRYTLFIFIFIIWFFAFFYPQFLIRNKAEEIKSCFFNKANKVLEDRFFSDVFNEKPNILDSLWRKLDFKEINAVEFYKNNYIRKIEKLDVWPFDISWLLSFLSSVAIPIIVSMITYMLWIWN